MSIKKNAVSGVKWTTLSTISHAISSLLKVSILARYLAKEDFGLMALIMFILGFMMLFVDMGLTAAILYKKNISKEEFSSLYWLNTIFTFLLYLMIFFLSPFVASFYNEAELTKLIPLAAVILIASSIGKQFKIIEQKHLKFKGIAIFEITGSLISLIIGIVLAVNHYGVYALVFATISQHVIANFLFFFNGLKKHNLRFHFKLEETKPFIRIGAYQTGGQIINYFNRDIDILIIGKFFGTDILGGYSLAKQLVLRPSQVINPILTKVASPVLAKFQASKTALKKNYLKLINIVSTINIPIYLLLVIFAPLAVSIFYGEGYDNIIILVRILCGYMFLRAIGNPIGSLVIATGRTDLEFKWNILILLVTPIAVLIGSQFGISWVAVSLVCVMVILFIPSWRFLVKNLTDASLKEFLRALFPNFKHLLRYTADN